MWAPNFLWWRPMLLAWLGRIKNTQLPSCRWPPTDFVGFGTWNYEFHESQVFEIGQSYRAQHYGCPMLWCDCLSWFHDDQSLQKQHHWYPPMRIGHKIQLLKIMLPKSWRQAIPYYSKRNNSLTLSQIHILNPEDIFCRSRPNYSNWILYSHLESNPRCCLVQEYHQKW